LDVDGDLALTGTIYANGDPIWLDKYGIIKANRNTIDEDVVIPANTNASSNGPLEINSGNTITITAGSTWTIN